MRTTANICDPDGVLSEQSRYRLDHDLKQLETRTRQDYGRSFCDKKGVTAAMAVAKHVKGGTTEAVETMANDMLRKWTLDPQCKKAVVIVVSTDDMKFWVARDDKVPVYADEFTQLFMQQVSDTFFNGSSNFFISEISLPTRKLSASAYEHSARHLGEGSFEARISASTESRKRRKPGTRWSEQLRRRRFRRQTGRRFQDALNSRLVLALPHRRHHPASLLLLLHLLLLLPWTRWRRKQCTEAAH